MHYELCIMNYLLSLHQSCGWQSVALPAGDILVKAFQLYPFYENRQFSLTEGEAVKNVYACLYSPLRRGAIYRCSVGWAVYFG